jgi:hypothetical protein
LQQPDDDECTQQDQTDAGGGLDRVVAKLVVEGYEEGEKGKDGRASMLESMGREFNYRYGPQLSG